MYTKFFDRAKPLVIPLLISGSVCLLFRFVFLLGYVPTASMEPTIPADSLIMGYRLYRDLAPGDIVIFQGEDSRILVKRIAVGPGGYTPEGDTVPDGCYYLLGDNADHSIDSRYWETPYIHEDQILAVLW